MIKIIFFAGVVTIKSFNRLLERVGEGVRSGSMLSHVGHVGLEGHSCVTNSWVILIGQTRRSFSWVKLVGHSCGSNSWIIHVGKTRGSNSWSFLVIHCHSCGSSSWVIWDPKIAWQFLLDFGYWQLLTNILYAFLCYMHFSFS